MKNKNGGKTFKKPMNVYMYLYSRVLSIPKENPQLTFNEKWTLIYYPTYIKIIPRHGNDKKT